jgi:hypothetical protein
MYFKSPQLFWARIGEDFPDFGSCLRKIGAMATGRCRELSLVASRSEVDRDQTEALLWPSLAEAGVVPASGLVDFLEQTLPTRREEIPSLLPACRQAFFDPLAIPADFLKSVEWTSSRPS